MDTFDAIINKIININNNIFSFNYKTDDVSGIYKIFFYNFVNNKNKLLYKNKIDYFNKTINNFYFSGKDRESEKIKFIDYFCKIQKVYHTLNRFCFLYKIKKAKQIVNCDLQLNEINLEQKNVICIYHNGYKYLFKMHDLLKIIYLSLTNTYLFFCEPITIKNPYNNLPFGKPILYYIYFYLLDNTYIGYIKHEYIDVFLKFKQCHFNVTKFVDKYEYMLRENSIKNYITNSTKNQIKNDILTMIKEYNTFYKKYTIDIDNDFPADILIKIMKPYLLLYLTANYSLVQKNQNDAKYRLNRKLVEFNLFNPLFGRKIIVLKNKIKNGKIIRCISHRDFNCRYKPFTDYNNKDFMSDHLSYRYGIDNDIDNNADDEDDSIESVYASVTATNNNANNVTVRDYYDEDDDADEESVS